MVDVEALQCARNPLDVEQALLSHWGLDDIAANELAWGVSAEGRDKILDLAAPVEEFPEGVEARDNYRQEIADIVTGKSDKQLIIVGPCSLEAETDYEELFDYITKLQEDNPDALVVMRANGSKPRTSGGWGGEFRSKDGDVQDGLIEIYREAFKRKIGIVTEITEKDEFATQAPYLSAVWLGARDMLSTSLHATMSATNIPVLVKNPQGGDIKAIENVLTAIGKSTHGDRGDDSSKGNEGSGVNLGIISATYTKSKYGLPAMLEVGEGNKNTGIIARGYSIEGRMSKRKRAKAAYAYIGEICTLAVKLGKKAIIDGQHDVPPMFDIEKTDEDRFLRVMRIINKAARQRKIKNAKAMGGFIVEMSPTKGRTDVNLPISIAKENNALDSLIKDQAEMSKELQDQEPKVGFMRRALNFARAS